MSTQLDANLTLRESFEDDTQAFKVQTVNTLIPTAYDYVSVAYPTATQEVYSFKSGGSSGTLIGTITINYTDATKANISDVTKS